MIASIVMIALSPPVWPGPDSQGSPSSLTFPGLVTIPIGFLGCWLGTMLSPTREEARTYDELLVRSETGLGSEGADPRRAPRRRRAARARDGHGVAEVGLQAPPASVRAGLLACRYAAGISWLARKISSGSTSALILRSRA